MSSEISRLVLAIAPGSPPEPADAVELARRLEVPLLVLFGQDGDLRRLGQLPGRAALRLAGGRTEPIRAGELDRELLVAARQVEGAARQAADRAGVSLRFEVHEGSLDAWLEAHGSAQDLLMLQRNMGPELGWRAPSLSVAWRAQGPVLLTARRGAGDPWRGAPSAHLGVARQSLLLLGDASVEPARAARAWVHSRGAEPLVCRLPTPPLERIRAQTAGALVQIRRADLLRLDEPSRCALVEAGWAVLVG